MNNKINKYCLRLWLTVAGVSFLLFQIPIYYLNYSSLNCITCSYGALLWDFVKNWFYIMLLLIPSWLLVFRFGKRLYQPYWSSRGFKIALLFTSEFLMLFFFVIYFFMFNATYMLPTSVMIGVFVLSNGISIYLHNYRSLLDDFYKQHLEQE